MTTLFSTLPASEVQQLEQAGFNAWPALHTVFDGPWLIRQADGVTKRANSINTLAAGHPPGTDPDDPARLGQRLDRCVALFRRHGLPPVFRASPLTPPDTVAELIRRGWTEKDPSLVMMGTLPIPESAPEPDLLSDHPTADWLETYARIDGLPSQSRCTVKKILRGIALPCATVCVHHAGHPASVALAVVDGPLMGLFCVGTLAEARRQGLSQRALSALLHWGRDQGADRLWLQVSAANSGAQALYRRMGLTPVYGYTYFVCPDPVAV